MRFLIITPDQHSQYTHFIEALHLNVFKEYFMRLPRPNQKKATYIIAYSPHNTFVGDAWMIQRPFRQAPPDVRKFYKKDKDLQHYWECAGIHSCLNPGNDPDEYFSAHFYQNLYRTILCYGERIEIDHVVVHVPHKEKEKIKYFGIWPLTQQRVDPQNFGMLYASLSLSEKDWDAYHKIKRCLSNFF